MSFIELISSIYVQNEGGGGTEANCTQHSNRRGSSKEVRHL